MKALKLTVSFLLLSTCLITTSCTKDQVENYHDNTKEIITQGKWTVEYFFSDQDLTAQYDNYNFVFLGNGSLTAEGPGPELTGTWSMIRDANRNDVIRIQVNSQDPHFAAISEQWRVTGKTLQSVNMADGNNQLNIRKL